MRTAQIFLNSQMAIQPYASHLAVHTQTQMQTEAKAFKAHFLLVYTMELLVLTQNQHSRFLIHNGNIESTTTVSEL